MVVYSNTHEPTRVCDILFTSRPPPAHAHVGVVGDYVVIVDVVVVVGCVCIVIAAGVVVVVAGVVVAAGITVVVDIVVVVVWYTLIIILHTYECTRLCNCCSYHSNM